MGENRITVYDVAAKAASAVICDSVQGVKGHPQARLQADAPKTYRPPSISKTSSYV